jgi:hypothetical protein
MVEIDLNLKQDLHNNIIHVSNIFICKATSNNESHFPHAKDICIASTVYS